ncbi:ATP-binding cassette domain-containing protein [Bradyrhizobium sp.]|uniref:ABC transporter ATP-binding protein n=1 Tax=Bradyrhizobium sp. TaxID=376 RepID=UPI002606119B|nr:ATP-binding cassette domain-containing protein [Bradyrhizobium sp.]
MLLELVGLGRHFGGLNVIKGLDLTVAEGEILGIIGPNGAGKSTLFNLIGGNLAPNSGRIVYAGRDITRMTSWHRCRVGIGRTFQIPRPFHQMTVYENVLVAAVHGSGNTVARAKGRAQAVLEQTGLWHRQDMPAGRLSLLDLKRLELAKALALTPKLLLLDELAGGLTDAECNGLLDIVRKVHSGGTTVVWIEHVIRALRRIAGRFVVLYGGNIFASGTPDEVLADARVKEVYLGAEGNAGDSGQ